MQAPISPASEPARGGAGAPYSPDSRTVVYLWLSAAFVTALLLANILGVKLFVFDLGYGGYALKHTVGMLAFPVTFLLTDLLNEYYGKRAARRVVYVAFVMGAIAFAMIYAARRMPALEGYAGTADQASFDAVFGSAVLMYIASLVAFLLGSVLDIFLFGVFKKLTGGRLVWLRATGSTVVSQVFDSFVVTFVAFDLLQRLVENGEPWAFEAVMSTAATGYVLKFLIAVALTPAIYLGRWVLREWFGLTPLPASAVR